MILVGMVGRKVMGRNGMASDVWGKRLRKAVENIAHQDQPANP